MWATYMRKSMKLVTVVTCEKSLGRSSETKCDVLSLDRYVQRLQRLVCEGVARGVVQPLTRVTCPARRASLAARWLADKQRPGRLLLRLVEKPLAELRYMLTLINPKTKAEQIIKPT